MTPYRRQLGDRISYNRAQTSRYRSNYLRWRRSFAIQPIRRRRAGQLQFFDFESPRALHTVTYDPGLDTRGQPGSGDYTYQDCTPDLLDCLEVRGTATLRRSMREFQAVGQTIEIDIGPIETTETLVGAWRLVCPGDRLAFVDSTLPPAWATQGTPFSLTSLSANWTNYFAAFVVQSGPGPWPTLVQVRGGYRYERQDSPSEGDRRWNGEDYREAIALDLEWRDPVTQEPVSVTPCINPLVLPPSSSNTDDGYRCTCPDYTRQEPPDLRSPYPSRSRLRSWVSSRAGAPDPPRCCKHIYAAMRARGENPRDPRESDLLVFGWADLPLAATPPDADPRELLRGLRDRRRQRQADRRAAFVSRIAEIRDYVTRIHENSRGRRSSIYRNYVPRPPAFQPQLNPVTPADLDTALRRLRDDYLSGYFEYLTSVERSNYDIIRSDPSFDTPYRYSRPITGDEVYRYLYRSLRRQRDALE